MVHRSLGLMAAACTRSQEAHSLAQRDTFLCKQEGQPGLLHFQALQLYHLCPVQALQLYHLCPVQALQLYHLCPVQALLFPRC